jgi:hypothetical protein
VFSEESVMSRHVSRGERWSRRDSRTDISELGRVVFLKGAWYALLEYRTRAPGEPAGRTPTWEAHARQLGPFRRPRNAMVELEREAAFLRNTLGANVCIGDQANSTP